MIWIICFYVIAANLIKGGNLRNKKRQFNITDDAIFGSEKEVKLFEIIPQSN